MKPINKTLDELIENDNERKKLGKNNDKGNILNRIGEAKKKKDHFEKKLNLCP